ncbi:MAG: hypothetical protein HYW26_04320 [Candidatus Aenigmarchaeota archaeon]|nr:hypothetical protein [Candidatus Aenigmarchaeota archaeon]
MKRLLALFVMLLFAGAAFAYTLEYTQDTIRVPVSGMRQTHVKISSDSDDSFLVSPADAKTWVTTDKTIVSVGRGGSENFTVFFSPSSSVPQGLHKISFDVESRGTKERKRADLYAFVYKSEGIETEGVFLTGDLIPSGTVSVRFSLRNIGDVKVQNINVKTSAYSPEGKIYESSDVLNLEPEDVKTLEKSFQLKENAPPGDYSISIKVTQLEAVLSDTTEKFVVARKAVLKDMTTTNINLLKKEKVFLFKNVGNDVSEPLLLTEKITKFDSNFFKGDPPERTEGDTYVWTLPPVAPGGLASIKYSLDYSPLFYTLIVIFGLLWLYLTRFRTLRVSKYILQKKHIREGEEFTVGVEVKNYSGKSVDSAEVYDFVPTIFQMKDTEGPKPLRKKSESGIELKWAVSNLRPNEERVLTYKIIPVVELSGTINLPQASVVFAANNKETENFSNTPAVGLEMQGEEKQLHQKIHGHIKKLMGKGNSS